MTPSPRGREEHRTLEVRKAELIASETTCCLPNLCPSHGEDEAAGENTESNNCDALESRTARMRWGKEEPKRTREIITNENYN
jgi:hypothetical protein